MLEIMHYDGRVTRTLSLDELKAVYPVFPGMLWIDLSAPSLDEIQMVLIDLCHFHPITVDDCTTFIDHPRLDEYDDYLSITFHSPIYHEAEARVSTWEVDFFVGGNYVITNHLKPIPFLPDIKQRFFGADRKLVKGPDFLVQHLLETMVNHYVPILNKIRKKLDEVEREVLTGAEHDTFNDIYRIKRNLSSLKKIILPQIEVLYEIKKFEDAYFSTESMAWFNDVENHLEKIKIMVDDYMQMGQDSFNAFMSISSFKMNVIMKRLTVIMTLFMPLTVLSGIGGMSEWSMITGASPNNWMTQYVLFILFMLVCGFLTYYILKWLKWV